MFQRQMLIVASQLKNAQLNAPKIFSSVKYDKRDDNPIPQQDATPGDRPTIELGYGGGEGEGEGMEMGGIAERMDNTKRGEATDDLSEDDEPVVVTNRSKSGTTEEAGLVLGTPAYMSPELMRTSGWGSAQ